MCFHLLTSRGQKIVQMAAIRTLMEAGVFHTIPKGGASMTADEISAHTRLDKNILSMDIMDRMKIGIIKR